MTRTSRDFLTAKPPAPPSSAHPLGTDTSGRDVLARLALGARTSLIVGFGAVAVYVTIGTLIGMLAGFLGGVVDQVLMRLTDIVLAIPALLLVIIFVSIVGPSLISVIAIIGLLGWPSVARNRPRTVAPAARSGVHCRRPRPGRRSSTLSGGTCCRTWSPLTVLATFGVATAILLEAALSFLGLGVQPPEPSLGNMIIEARAPSVLHGAPWFWLPAGLLIALLVLGVELRR